MILFLNKMAKAKIWYFTVSGKIEAGTESEATDLIYEMLEGKTQFQIESLEVEG